MSEPISVTTEHNTQPPGPVPGSSEVWWILLKQEDKTVINIGLIDYADGVLAKNLHVHLTKATREFVKAHFEGEGNAEVSNARF